MTATQVSIVEAIERGSLGPFALGVSRHIVGEVLGEPTDATFANRKRTSCIWRYGTVEFHFNHDLLTLIHCDADALFDGGPSLIIEPWKLRLKMPLDELKSILDAKDLYYTGCDDPYAPECVLRLDSGFSVGFVLDPSAGLGSTGLTSWSIIKNG
ncbi:hypothetical protein [Stieleria varia]|uniref:Uncharacterized protein n=1 Tax=Stieleria varia TaxID=2528005 RepID=A0A5C6AGS4_9BACT|nr:hypothetical protein [Stieleria varia]TWT98271.1 hypothetical protein Pla52n_47810 [Stieleria varia]